MAKVHLGSRASALAAWLNKHLGLTFSKTARVLEQLCGLKVTRGGLSQALDRDAYYFIQLRGFLHAAMALGRPRTDLPPPEVAQARQDLDQQADALLLSRRRDPEEERVANRSRKRRQWLFTFLYYPAVEATNNRARRALRLAVIARKLSRGNKTERGKPGQGDPGQPRGHLPLTFSGFRRRIEMAKE